MDVQGRVAVGAERPGVPDRQRRTLRRSAGRWSPRSIRPPGHRCSSVATARQTGAGWNAFNSNRSKPQVKAQIDLLPARARAAATTSSSASRIAPRLVSPRHQRPVRTVPHLLSRHVRRAGNADRIRFVGRRRATAISTTAGRPRPTSISTTRSTGRIAGRRPIGCRSPPDCGLITRTCRTPMVIRKPVVSTATTAAQVGDGGRIFPARDERYRRVTADQHGPRGADRRQLLPSTAKARASSRRFTDAITTTSPTASLPRIRAAPTTSSTTSTTRTRTGSTTASASWARTARASAVPTRRSTRT